MSIRVQENALFNDWEKGRDRFVKDGMVTEAYISSKSKIAVILKEVNSPKTAKWDLREFVERGAVTKKGKSTGGYTFNNVTRWVYGMRLVMRNEPIVWKNINRVTQETRRDVLKDICVMNLKKSPGKSSSYGDVVCATALTDKDYFQKQYALYDPGITICGGIKGTFNSFRKVAEHGENCNTTKNGVRWYARDFGKYVIDYYHPNARKKDLEMFNNLMEAIKEIQAR